MQSTEEKRNKFKNIFIRCSILLLCVVSLALYFGKYLGLPDWNDVFVSAGLRAEMDENLSVCFLSVGTADAIYIHQDETDVLIDAGTRKSFTNIDTFLKRYDCKGFDAVFVTHPDYDHIGGMSQILDNYETENLYMYNYSADFLSDAFDYNTFENSIKENNINKVFVSSTENENKIIIGDLCFEVISPESEFSDINETSLVLKMTYGKNSFLFTGDIGEEAENEIITKYPNLKCDVLKVAHHGSKYSSTQNFLNVVSPKISVISSGDDNMYLPDFNTQARLAEISDVYITSRDGNVLVRSDGQIIEIQTKV